MARDPVELSGADRQGARERAFRLLAGTVAALFLAFASLGGVFLWYDNAANWVSHTHQVRSGISNVLQALADAESAQRGYVLTGDRIFVDQVARARAKAKDELDTVARLTADNPEQQTRLDTLRAQMGIRLTIIDQTMAARAAGAPVAAIRIIREGRGIAAMNEIRRLVAGLDAAEASLESQRADRAATIRVMVLISLVAFAALLALLFVKAMRDINLDREVESDTAERLRALLADRTLLLDEVNHRVKNSLQQIASVVRLQSRAAAHPEAKDALDKTLSRIMAVGRVHEQLYKAGSQVGQFDAGAYAQALAHELVESMGRDDIELVTQVQPISLDVRQAAPLALILNELITNALKYGCPADEAPRIQVTFGPDGDDYRLSVSDNGNGLPKGFTPKKTKSLGMRAIDALTRQLGGRFEIEDVDRGASFAVVFPRSTV
ncbi:MAG: CHASE3 domain-containing protein [Phenylobacterium sp.]|uniref:sensor histidine kinase n=1 Tax=Phenylobacterium sp. TaxID=1871053 RepID=UPI003BB70B54